MSWSMPTAGQWNPGVGQPVIPQMPAQDMSAMGNYTPDQWTMMQQQQNWQQWTQWQQQYAQWQSQYGDKYAQQMQAMQMQQMGGQMAGQIPGQIPGPMGGQMTGQMGAQMPGQMGGQMPGQMGGQMPGQMGGQMPGQMGGYPLPPSNAPLPAPPPPDKPPPPPPHENDQPLYGNNLAAPGSTSYARGSRKTAQSHTKNLGNNQWTPVESKQSPSVVNAEALKKLAEEERLFDIQFQKWEEEIDKWKKENVNHPDRQAYDDYEKKFEACRAQLLERRRQMKLKRDKLLSATPQAETTPVNNNTPTSQPTQEGKKGPQPLMSIRIPPPATNTENSATNQAQNYPNQNNLQQNQKNNDPTSFNRSNNVEAQDTYDSYKNDDNSDSNSHFLASSAASKGIPGLDLVPEDKASKANQPEVIDITEEQNENTEPKAPDYNTISKGINNILGDEKIMNILSMVRDQVTVNKDTPKTNAQAQVTVQATAQVTTQATQQLIPQANYNTPMNTQWNTNAYNNQMLLPNTMYNMPQAIVPNPMQQSQPLLNHGQYSMQQSQLQNPMQQNYPQMQQGPPQLSGGLQDQYYGEKVPYNQNYQNQNYPNMGMQDMSMMSNMAQAPPRQDMSTQQNSFSRDMSYPPPGPKINEPTTPAVKQPTRPPWVEEPLFSPSIIVEYEHKPLRLKARDFIEPVHTFDYNHKSKDDEFKRKDIEREVDEELFSRKPRRPAEYEDEMYGRRGPERFPRDSRDPPSRDFDRRPPGDFERRPPPRDERVDTRSRLPPRDSYDDRRRPDERHDDRRRDDRDRFSRKDDGFGRKDDGFSRRDDGFGRREEGHGRRDDGFGRRDEGLGRRDEGLGRRDEGLGRRDEGLGRRDEGLGRRDEGLGRRDEGFNRRDDAFGRRDEGFSKRDEGFSRRDDNHRDRERDRDRNRDNRRDDNRTRSKSPRDSRKRGVSKESETSTNSAAKKSKDPSVATDAKDTPFPEVPKHIVMIDDILEEPGRGMRPEKIVIILRGPPGSGKSYLAKLIRDKEAEYGSTARIMSIDDYFMQEVEIEEKDPATGKLVKKSSMKYEYDAKSEETYLNSLKRAFKRTLTDGYFPFLIFDAANEQLRSYADIWNFARQAGFQVYICTMDLDPQVCYKRNIHNRSLEDIQVICSRFFETPAHHIQLDATTLLQNGAIPEVHMEDVDDDVIMEDTQEEEEVDSSFTSKWEKMDDASQLARLDGTSKPLRSAQPSMEDYLQLDDWTPSKAKPGKKSVRWADLEERRQQEKMRAIGFVVGQTDWNRMTDPTMGSSALTQTKYIERVRRN